jgi:hypothetical protein
MPAELALEPARQGPGPSRQADGTPIAKTRGPLAVSLGGQAVVDSTDIPGVGRFSVKDPQGGTFCIVELAAPAKGQKSYSGRRL